MWLLIKRFLAVLCVLALVGGGTISFAANTSASEPCAHEHGDASGIPHQHDHHGAGCLACCLGACVAIPDLPQRSSLSDVKFAVATAAYWEATVSLSDRSIPPDLGPPRTIA